jgi:hypothetical protein
VPSAPSSPRSATSSARRLGTDNAGKHDLELVLEQVAEASVGKPPLRLGRPRQKDTQPPLTRILDAGQPERRLADSRLAFQHQCLRSVGRLVEEGVDGAEFLVSADDFA